MSSATLSANITSMINAGHHFTDTSTKTDRILSNAMKNKVIPYAKTLFSSVSQRSNISLYECQKRFGMFEPDKTKNNVYMKPDGGILFYRDQPILVSEMKVQGTNDRRLADGKSRQALGNAIERASKNIRGAEMFFDTLPVFPYVIFAAGCDFHSSETIATRFEMMNYGIPNKTITVTPEKTSDEISIELNNYVENLDIFKKRGKSFALIFVKAHKWDKMPHGSSLWTEDEIFIVLKAVLDRVSTVFPLHSLDDSSSS
jgi:hypothetical protein